MMQDEDLDIAVAFVSGQEDVQEQTDGGVSG